MNKIQLLKYIERISKLYGYCLEQVAKVDAVVEHNAVIEAATEVFHAAVKQGQDYLCPAPAPLGFCDVSARTIYLDSSLSPPWYFWDALKQERVPIPHQALRGELVKLQQYQEEFKGKPVPKLYLFLQADHLYKIKAGLDTLFARSLCLALAQLRNLQNCVITIQPDAGDEGAIFCRVYYEGNRVVAPWPQWSDAEWISFVQDFCSKFEERET